MVIIEEKTCKPCQIAGAIIISRNICQEHNLSCDEISQAIKDNKEPEKFVGIIKEIRDKADGQAKEHLSIVIDELSKRLEENNKKEGSSNG